MFKLNLKTIFMAAYILASLAILIFTLLIHPECETSKFLSKYCIRKSIYWNQSRAMATTF